MAVVDSMRTVPMPEVGQRQKQGTEWESWYLRWALGLDFLSMLLGGLAAFGLRFQFSANSSTLAYIAFTAALPVLWLATLALRRAYEPRLIGIGSEEFRRVLHAGFVLTAAVAIVAYATKTEVARGYVIMALPIATGLNVLARYRLRKWLHARRGRGECMRRVVAVGHRSTTGDLVRVLREKRYHGMKVVGVCLPPALFDGDDAVQQVEGVPVLGDFGQVAGVVEDLRADSVAVLACPEMDGTALRRLAWQLERNSVELLVAPALMDVAGPRISIRPVSGLSLLHLEHPELTGGRRVLKALFDRTVALALLTLSAPVLLVIAALIRLTSSGPALFKQRRVGQNGTEFTLFKFRTMVVDAEQRKAELMASNEHEGEVLFKIKKDPRVTRVGAWLRRRSLDELPQLLNVLRGEMSLVGPRPPLPEEVAQYGHDVRRRLVVQPGMTGLWQVSGRSDLSWDESVRLDLRYVENWTLTMDLLIIWKTWSAVMRGSGAY